MPVLCRTVTVIILSACLWLPAVAAKPLALTADQMRQLRQNLVTHFKEKKYRKMIAVAQRLHKATDKPVYLSYIALGYDLLGEDEGAIASYRRFIREGSDPQRLQSARERLKIVTARFRRGKREVQILSVPTNATVTINGKPVRNNRTPTVLWLPKGKHTITARFPGYQPVTREVQIDDGPPMAITLTLARQSIYGYLSVTSGVDGTLVFVGNQLVGRTPLLKHRLLAGTHHLRVTAEGYLAWERVVQIKEAENTSIHAELRQKTTPVLVTTPTPQKTMPGPMTPYRIAAWVTLSSGVAILGAGLGFHLLARKKSSDANSLAKGTAMGNRDAAFFTSYDDLLSQKTLYRRLGLGFFVAGGVLTTASIILFFVKPGRERVKRNASNWRITPIVSSDGLGLSGEWRF